MLPLANLTPIVGPRKHLLSTVGFLAPASSLLEFPSVPLASVASTCPHPCPPFAAAAVPGLGVLPDGRAGGVYPPLYRRVLAALAPWWPAAPSPSDDSVPAKIADLAEINPPDRYRALAGGDLWLICCFSSPWSWTPRTWEAGQAAVLQDVAHKLGTALCSSTLLLPRAWGRVAQQLCGKMVLWGKNLGWGFALKQKRSCRGELRRGIWLLAFPSPMCCLLRDPLGGFTQRLCFQAYC